uniref:X-Pro dipeptidyl-peptidase n=1 Tax=Thermosporothrix sp. COM3 TaxID=2490863 RepID=A0A455SUW8_9CHLR|nr:X-Pro dipeptidyl-peptidase [Thermosporothrix sp. COM3]
MTQQIAHQVTVDFDVPAKMRDGTILRANVYRPVGEGKWPVLLTRLPYGKDLSRSITSLDPLQTARRGYVVIVQDTRGRFTSGGEWEPMRHEDTDGYDTIAWAANLHYSNGQIGLFGGSYLGFTQWAALTQKPTTVKAAIPEMTWNDPFNGVMFRGGAQELGLIGYWYMGLGTDVLMRQYQNEPDPRKFAAALHQYITDLDALGPQGYWSLPLKEFTPFKRNAIAPMFFELYEHYMDRSFTESATIRGKHGQVTVPTLNIAGWYDIFLQDTIENFRILHTEGSTPEARQSKLLIGPWTHGGYFNPIGEINYGTAASAMLINMQYDLATIQQRWFDYYLKGIDNGVASEAPVKLFVMGANVWRDEQEWPLARAVETRYYLHSDGHANTLKGDGLLTTETPADEQPDHYDYDPANPVPTRGGALLMPPEFRPGPWDQRPIESREDVLVYSTPVLEQDVEVTGPITVHLWAISSAPDTDFVARLIDVHPDGYAQNLTDGIIRARYRHATHGGTPSLLEPGKAYEYDIDLWATSNLFKKGHRIRLDITSSCFPRWDRNLNTGHDIGTDSEMAVAHQTILHDADHPSYIVLPIVPQA